MSEVTDPVTGLEFYELSHPWGHGIPVFPGDQDVRIHRGVKHAQHGVMSQTIKTTMQNSTHVNAPIHLVPGAAVIADLPLDCFFGNGIVLDISRSRWDLIEPSDLEPWEDRIRPHDLVMINTGWHRFYDDTQEYFGDAPGLSPRAAAWLVEKEVCLVGIDTPSVDHPLATSLGEHRGGPLMKRLPDRYRRETGRDPKADHPLWLAAHKTLLAAGIPTIENLGGNLDAVTGRRCTFHCLPWRWQEGDGCVVRVMAMLDPSGQVRIDSGTGE